MPGFTGRFADGTAIHIDYADDYKPGDMPPTGHMDWMSWAEVQHKAGLRQVECGMCGKYQYPQELSDARESWDRRFRVCKGCERKAVR